MSTVGTSLSKEDVAALEGISDAVPRLFLARDWVGWAALFAEDGILHPPNHAGVRGRAALEKWAAKFPETDALEFSDVQILGEDSLAYITTRFVLTIKGLPPDTGKQLVVCRRGTSGWQVVAASFNSDLPLTS